MKNINGKRVYNIFENILYCNKKIKEFEGSKYFILALLTIVFAVVTPLVIAIFPSIVIKLLLSDIQIGVIAGSVIGLAVGLCLLQAFEKYIQNFTDKSRFFYRGTFTKEVIAKSMAIHYEYLESSEGKNLINRALTAVYTNDKYGVEAILKNSEQVISNLLGLIVYSIITSSLNPLLILLLLGIPIVNFLLLSNKRKWIARNKELRAALDVKLKYLEDECLNVKHGKDIRLYNIELWFVKRFIKIIDEYLLWVKKELVRNFIAQFANRFMNVIRDICCYGYLIYRVSNGMGVAEFTLYLGIISGYSRWIENIFKNINSLLENNIILNDLRELVELPEIKDTKGQMTIPRKETYTITLENVYFKYSGIDIPVFEDFNLTIKSGEKLAVVGLNGAGKSTLVKLICGLYKPQKGRILLNGIDISKFSLKEYYSLFSMVFQEVFAFAFPIVDNITCSDDKYSKEKVNEALGNSGLLGKINSLPKGIDTNLLKELEEDGVNFSGGEMQKLMLARALYKDSSILILDEPTAALDPLAEFEMYKKYNSFAKGKTSIFISHRLSSTVFCDRVIFLKNGKVIEDGTHDELMQLKGEYANMYELQSHYYQKEVEEIA